MPLAASFVESSREALRLRHERFDRAYGREGLFGDPVRNAAPINLSANQLAQTRRSP